MTYAGRAAHELLIGPRVQTMPLDEDQLLRHLMSVVGIRAPMTAAAVLQLITELRRVNILDDEAVTRIKDAIVRAAVEAGPSHSHRTEFEAEVRDQLDRLFAIQISHLP